MADMDHLDCRIYVDGQLGLEELTSLVAGVLSGSVSGTAGTQTVHLPSWEIDIRRNGSGDQALARDFPDGFLYFDYCIEVYVSAEQQLEARIRVVESLLKALWARCIPAVASCDYEAELPHQGGYNAPSVPWPKSEEPVTK